jgi:nitronate monooxygenase
MALGGDAIVAQGSESGGHGARQGRSTLSFVPVVADPAAPVPVLAAGGIAEGRGVSAALCLGAVGALSGPASSDSRDARRSRGRQGHHRRMRGRHRAHQRPGRRLTRPDGTVQIGVRR